jgi:hypothetical protein
MKYDIAVISSILSAAILIGAGYVDSERTARNAVTIRAAVSTLSIQQLAPEIAACDSFRGSRKSRDPQMVYCAEVIRAMDTQPLQAVVIRPFEMIIPAPALPRPKLQKFPAPVPEKPEIPFEYNHSLIFPAPRVS